jgi:eukaryotic-like serine/threonine-protein kinase
MIFGQPTVARAAMADDPRVEALVEELLNSHGDAEEICRDCPELLPQVRAEWQRALEIQTELEVLFPDSARPDDTVPPAASVSQLPKIADHEVLEVLGHGGAGVVYKAWHLRLDRPVAVKMLLAGPFARPQELERFVREAQAAAGLNHPNIVQIYEVGNAEGRPYFTMEFVEGGSLAQKLAGVPQPVRQAATLTTTLAETVQVAHQNGIIHRDLKPANVLLTAAGIPKIADFGLARRMEDAVALTQSGTPLGTPSYMAPEQAGGKTSAVGPVVDVYALGAILYELLTGRPPFRGESGAETVQQVLLQEPVPPSRLNPTVPRDLETICLKCLRKEPDNRYASAAALSNDLTCFLEGRPIQARPLNRIARFARWCRRNPTLRRRSWRRRWHRSAWRLPASYGWKDCGLNVARRPRGRRGASGRQWMQRLRKRPFSSNRGVG